MNLHKLFPDDDILIRLIDSTSFEIEETLDSRLALISKSNRRPGRPLEWGNVFFDPNGEKMYFERHGRLHEWKLRAREEGPEWWIGEG